MEKQGIDWSEIAYIGNDINDLECLRNAGISFVPKDAYHSVLSSADFVLSHNGGNGAIREMAEIILSLNEPN